MAGRWSRVVRCSWLSLPTTTKSPLGHMVTEVAVRKGPSVVQAQPVSKIPVTSIRPNASKRLPPRTNRQLQCLRNATLRNTNASEASGQ